MKKSARHLIVRNQKRSCPHWNRLLNPCRDNNNLSRVYLLLDHSEPCTLSDCPASPHHGTAVASLDPGAERNEAERKALEEEKQKELSDSNLNQIALLFSDRIFITGAIMRNVAESLPVSLTAPWKARYYAVSASACIIPTSQISSSNKQICLGDLHPGISVIHFALYDTAHWCRVIIFLAPW